ncbi:hypothetical protein PHYPO_G00239900 [Pangasianodon hypophthalmus]|uniref:Ig-like domain-containing protein n=1 Tax=Pangasianodon hypophthalmus TaxID=310915 RepID=A0A5N5NEA0_PANHP|nr:hypothetical protein PHYPO_G00239900 [Pangasianodon hypophthalmus]
MYKRYLDDRYSVLPDSSLLIKSLSLSDSGIYQCSGYAVVNLTVTPSSARFSQSRTEGRNIRLHCDEDREVFWTKHTDNEREFIYFDEEEQAVFICKRGPDSRYIVLPDSSLLIKNALVSDSGIYHCDADLLINLTVIPSKVLIKSLMNTYTAISAMREATANCTEGSNIILHCENQEKVTWSKYNDEGRMDLYITQNKGRNSFICKLDVRNHFKILPDSSLAIRNLSLSDSGIYYCKDSPVVNLTVTPLSAQFDQSRTEGTNFMIYCYSVQTPFWTKRINEETLDVLFTQDKENTIMYKRDPDKRYVILPDSSLVIRNASVSDSGIYYCKHSPVVNLTVFPLKGGVSGVERGLMFGGGGLAGLVFLLATVAAGRAIVHRA